MASTLPGIGPKQASMFLRNLGVSYDLAVIDRHIINFMVFTGFCDAPPRNLGTLKSYETQENILKDYAAQLGYSVGILDFAIWIVMRTMSAMNLRL
jgi:N-glycosylase/DNA lyase